MSRLTATLAAAALCSGCLGSALESKREAPEVYRLSAPVLSDSGGALPASLAVGRPRAPVSLDTARIAVAGPQTRFDYYAGVRWAEPAPLMLQQLLVQALASDGRFATVVAAPSRVPSEFLLDVELRQFEATSDGSGAPVVRVRLQATLMDSRSGTAARELLRQVRGRGRRRASRRGRVRVRRGDATGARLRRHRHAQRQRHRNALSIDAATVAPTRRRSTG